MALKVLNSGDIKFPDAEPYKFEPGDELDGHLVDTVEIQGKKGPFKKYVVDTGDQTYVSFLGNRVLDEHLPNLDLGTRVNIKYEGMKESKSGNRYHSYIVGADEEDRISIT